MMKYIFPIKRQICHFKRLNWMYFKNNSSWLKWEHWKKKISVRMFSWSSFSWSVNYIYIYIYNYKPFILCVWFWVSGISLKHGLGSIILFLNSISVLLFLAKKRKKAWIPFLWLYKKCWYFSIYKIFYICFLYIRNVDIFLYCSVPQTSFLDIW